MNPSHAVSLQGDVARLQARLALFIIESTEEGSMLEMPNRPEVFSAG